MRILSKTVEIEAQMPVDNIFIEQKLKEAGLNPLRWAIVNVNCNKLTVSVAYENL